MLLETIALVVGCLAVVFAVVLLCLCIRDWREKKALEDEVDRLKSLYESSKAPDAPQLVPQTADDEETGVKEFRIGYTPLTDIHFSRCGVDVDRILVSNGIWELHLTDGNVLTARRGDWIIEDEDKGLFIVPEK